MQEVVTGERPRFSISGWYHKDAPQEGSAHASLQQLQMKAGEDQIQGHTDFEGEEGNEAEGDEGRERIAETGRNPKKGELMEMCSALSLLPLPPFKPLLHPSPDPTHIHTLHLPPSLPLRRLHCW